ncbi:hypothetical protein FHX37_3715 [Haloactinospora alba]|uniref:Sulfotransferase family protein n=1 Tax=Haloactinospora alba TaxID=405555 RepID=A0A543N989_9ACTN|nr:sulfotransferase family protein [Haloactinospora alba]TQN28378.1 hypothetical protein FHX37_3715 [Haloactinospora alba]
MPHADRPRLLVLWSPPRCRSTAFLRMMRERGDFTVVHEPLSHVHDFGAADVHGTRCTSGEAVLEALDSLSRRTPVFVKDTTDFPYPEVHAAEWFLRSATHTFLIREPRAAIASHYRLNPSLGRDEIGFARVRRIHDAVTETGARPVVVDADELVDRPHAVVRAYCDSVGIPFLPAALSWPATTLPEWRRTLRWHTDVADSTGFTRGEGTHASITDHPVLGPHYRYHLPHYLWLRERRMRVSPGG